MSLSILRRKLITLLSNPSAVARKYRYRGIVRPLRKINDRWGRFQLSRHGIDSLLARRAASALPPHWGDLWNLYREIRRRRPLTVLEFGCGCSTLVIAQALADNRRSNNLIGRFYSVDCNELWANAARKALPEHLAPICHITHSAIVVEERFRQRVVRHAAVPDIVPDFIYIDGPEFPPELQRDERVVVDLLDIHDRLSPGAFIVIDGRSVTVDFLRKFLPDFYAYKSSHVFRRHSLERIR